MTWLASILLLFLSPRRSMYVLHIILTQIQHLCYAGDGHDMVNEFRMVDLLLEKKVPTVYKILHDTSIQSSFYCAWWLCCMFCNIDLPIETLLRIWYKFIIKLLTIRDVILHEGTKVCYRVSLALFMVNEEHFVATTMEQVLTEIRYMPRRCVDPNELLSRAFNISNFSKKMISKLRQSLN
jgi:hypothetical protein